MTPPSLWRNSTVSSGFYLATGGFLQFSLEADSPGRTTPGSSLSTGGNSKRIIYIHGSGAESSNSQELE
ncbi:unnamed protein product [Arctogadus glacialis]